MLTFIAYGIHAIALGEHKRLRLPSALFRSSLRLADSNPLRTTEKPVQTGNVHITYCNNNEYKL
jgi:hypothetical protein